MSTITIKNLELDADLDREAMRKVSGGNSMRGRNSIGRVQGPIGSFQHEASSEKDTRAGLPGVSNVGLPAVAGSMIPGGDIIGAAIRGILGGNDSG